MPPIQATIVAFAGMERLKSVRLCSAMAVTAPKAPADRAASICVGGRRGQHERNAVTSAQHSSMNPMTPVSASTWR